MTKIDSRVVELGDMLIIDPHGVEDAAQAAERFAAALKQAAATLDEIRGKAHGGIDIRIVGEIASITIHPAHVQ